MKLATILLCTAVTGLVACGDKSSKKKAPEENQEEIPEETLTTVSETESIGGEDIAVATVDADFINPKSTSFGESSTNTITLSEDVSNSVPVPNTTDNKRCTAGLPKEVGFFIMDYGDDDKPDAVTFHRSEHTDEDGILFPNNPLELNELKKEKDGLQVWESEVYEEDGLFKIRQFSTDYNTQRVSMTTLCWVAPNQ